MNPIVEVVTDRLVAPGVIAHLRGGVRYDPVQYPGMVVYREAPFPMCRPITHQGDAETMFSYSAGWAAEKGAIPCPDSRCFGGES